jgi:hypothetical protein
VFLYVASIEAIKMNRENFSARSWPGHALEGHQFRQLYLIWPTMFTLVVLN